MTIRLVRAPASAALLALVIPLWGAPASLRAATAVGRADYESMQEWRFTAQPQPVPAGGLILSEDVGEWRLESGRIWLQEPTSDGAVTGLVFEGKGRLRLAVPDRFELQQLRRFAGEPELETLEEEFSVLVVRASPERIARLGLAANAPYRRLKGAGERHGHWLRMRSHDADARVLAALANPAERYLRVDAKTASRGWLTFDYDSRRPEEIKLERFHPGYAFLEHWLSLDRSADRQPSGRPGPVPEPHLEVEHADLAVELLRLGKDPGAAASGRYTLEGDFRAELTFRVREPEVRALSLYLHPLAEVHAVRDAAGRELEFVRDNIGARAGHLDKRIHDDSLVVLLPEAASEQEPLVLAFDYEMEVTNFAPGRYWYPATTDREVGLGDPHTATLQVTTRSEYDVRAMGELVSESAEGDLETTVWRVDRPVKMATFSITKHLRELTAEREGLPRVVVFSPPLGRDTEGRLESLGEELLDSLEFLQGLLGTDLGTPELYATMIQAYHGQAFDGLLQLSEMSAYRPGGTGVTTLFLVHEVAHQWWGHQVGWGSYRDQWLSEGLAQYVAMMYVEERMEKGERMMQDILEAFGDELTGSIKSQFNRFSWPGTALKNKNAARRMGPTGHGYRAVTGEAPEAYFSQTYRKAALVVHSLRVLSRHLTGGEEAFAEILREFVRRHQHGYPTADDFAEIVAQQLPGEWDWFFDQWIHGQAIPSYRWSYESTSLEGGGAEIALRVRQEDVPPGFRMLVPVRVELRGAEPEEHLVLVDRPESEVRLEVAGRPTGVVFNPEHAVLARVKRK